MASLQQIAEVIGDSGISGMVTWHVPHEINMIPDQVIRAYSPPVILPPERGVSCGIKIEPVELPGGNWIGKFTELDGPWDQGAVKLLKKLELDYSPHGPSLVANNVEVDDTWTLAEYRVHLTTKPGTLRDVLIWQNKGDPVYQYVSSYTWCRG